MTHITITSGEAPTTGPEIEAVARRTVDAGTVGIFGSLALIYVWFGGMKFTAYEAEAISRLVQNSPLLAWVYDIVSVRGFGIALGLIEVTIGLLIAARLVSPILSAVGGLLSIGTFIVTLSFLFSTPGIVEPSLGFPGLTVMPGQFLLKDVVLLAASVFVVGNSLTAVTRR